MQPMNPGSVISEPVNSTTDLEWMLQSNQVSDSELLQALVTRYYTRIYCLAGLLLDKKNSQDEPTPTTLRISAEQALLCIVKNRHRYWGDPELPAWIFGLALVAIQKTDQTFRIPTPPVDPAMQTDSRRPSLNRNLHMLIAALDPSERLLLFLRYRSGLSIPGLGHVLRLSQTDVSAQLQTLSNAMQPLLENILNQNPLDTPVPQVDAAPPNRIETRIVDYMSSYWLLPDISAVDESLITDETTSLLKESSFLRKLALHAKEIAVVGLIIIVVVGLGGVMKITAPNPSQTAIARVGSSQAIMATEEVTPTITNSASPTLPAPLPVGKKAMLTIQTSDLPSQRTLLDNQVQSFLPVSDTVSFRDSGFDSLDAVLRFWGWDTGITATLTSSAGEVNAVSYEMINAVSEQTDLKVLLRVGGDVEALKCFLAAGFPIILARGFDGSVVHDGSGWLGVYGVVSGFDDVQQSFTFLDSPQVPAKVTDIPYAALERQWRAFDYLYLVIYPPSQAEKVNQVLGSQTNTQDNYRQAAEKASMDAYTSIYARDQFFAWFNRGVNLAYLNDQEGAAAAFDQAFSLYQKIPQVELPEQIVWYQTSYFRVYYETGRYQEMIDLAAMIISSPGFPQIEESYYWRALAEEALGDKTDAMQDLKAALRINPNYYPAVARLENLLRNG
jgi:hypothetical protein